MVQVAADHGWIFCAIDLAIVIVISPKFGQKEPEPKRHIIINTQKLM
jgi:hypothetical protein